VADPERTDLRMTAQRRAILDVLRKVTSHPTANELFARVRRRMPRISLATVYRNLDLMARRGVILCLPDGAGPRRFDGDTRAHAHIRCVDCGRVDDVPNPPPVRMRKGFEKDTGYEVLGQRVEFLGRCPDCRE